MIKLKSERKRKEEKKTHTHTNTRLNLRSILNLTLALCPNQFDFKPYLCCSKLQKFDRFNFFLFYFVKSNDQVKKWQSISFIF